MISFMKLEMLVSFLSKFGIDYYLLSQDTQTIAIILFQFANIFFYAVLITIAYKIINRIF